MAPDCLSFSTVTLCWIRWKSYIYAENKSIKLYNYCISASCCVQELPASLGRLNNLTILNVDRNQLVEIPREVSKRNGMENGDNNYHRQTASLDSQLLAVPLAGQSETLIGVSSLRSRGWANCVSDTDVIVIPTGWLVQSGRLPSFDSLQLKHADRMVQRI